MVHESRGMVLYLSDPGEGAGGVGLFHGGKTAQASNFYLPVYIGAIQGREMAAYERNYREDELKELSKAINYQFVKNLEEKGVQILENNDRIETSVSECRLTGELVTEESIVKTQPAAEPDMNSGGEPGEKPEETITAE